MEAITLTFGDCAENHVGMQQLGEKHAHGYTVEELESIAANLGVSEDSIEWYDLREISPLKGTQYSEEMEEAYLLVVRGYIREHEQLFQELKALEWDKKALMRGKVVNKHARYNLCFDEFSQEPDMENGKGTVVNIHDIPLLEKLYENVNSATGFENKVEGNYYYDLSKCGIGYHGDAERSKTLGVRLGGSFPICYRWYQNSSAISQTAQIMLNAGDLYVMSEKAAGSDWLKKKVPTLRHAAGCGKYTLA